MRRGRFGAPPPDGGPRLQRADQTGPRTGRPTLPGPATELVNLPSGVRVEQLVTGTGDPVTVFAHGLAGDITGTRPLGSAVLGRRVFFHFRGHGRSDAPPGPWTFDDLATELRAVADLGGATRALGVSLGAVALCRLIAATPDRFERVVLYLPAALDGTRPATSAQRLERLLASVESGEAAMIADAVEQDMPTSVRNTPAGWSFLRQRVEQLQRDGLAPELASLWSPEAPEFPAVSVSGTPGLPGFTGETELKKFTGRALVIGCLGDEAHPAGWAERIAASLPGAELEVFDRPAVLWNNRAALRDRISEFFNRP